jgi:hypothetical protein
MSDANLDNRPAAGNCPVPDAVYGFVDLARVWTRRRPSPHELAAFRPYPRLTPPSP